MDAKALIKLAKQAGIDVGWSFEAPECHYCKGSKRWLCAVRDQQVISPAGEVFTHKVKVDLGWGCFRCAVKEILALVDRYKSPEKPIDNAAYEAVLTELEQQCQSLKNRLGKLGKPIQAGPYR